MHAVSDNKGLEKLGLELHTQLLEGSRAAAEQIALHFRPLLVSALRKKYTRLTDPHLVEIASSDALLAYLSHPEKFNPARSSLIAWLYMDAQTNLLNLLRHEKRAEKHRSKFKDDPGNKASSIDPERRLMENESALVNLVQQVVVDHQDREVVSLMAQGERETSVYAEALGIEHVLPIKRAAIVKRHKDRLKVALRRALRRRRYLSILAALAVLGGRAKAAVRQNPTQGVALAAALLALLLANLFLWQKTSATRAQTEGALHLLGSAPPDTGDEEAKQSNLFETDGMVEKIFFTSNRAAASGTLQEHIFMMNADGSESEQMTFGDVSDQHVSVSPDGTKIAFTRRISPRSHNPNDDGSYSSIWVRDLASGIEIPLTMEIDYPLGEYQSSRPVWSPDGKQIAFQRHGSDPAGTDYLLSSIWIIDFLPSVGEPGRITPQHGFSRMQPEWSPDGHIYYMMLTVKDAHSAIYRINVKTGIEEEVIPVIENEYDPSISSDGKRLAWTAYRHNRQAGDIYIAELSNPRAAQQRVTSESGWSTGDWSPDGSRLIAIEARWRFSDKMLDGIPYWKIPREVIDKLRLAKRSDFKTERELMEIVRAILGDEMTVRYGYEMFSGLERAQNYWIANVDGSSFIQITSDLRSKGRPCWARISAAAAKTIRESQRGKRRNRQWR